MDLNYEGDIVGSRTGGSGSTVAFGSMWMMMAIIVLIVFFIVVIFIALIFKDRGHDRKDSLGTDLAGAIATITAANCAGKKNDYDLDRIELMTKLETSENRRMEADTQKEIRDQGNAFMQLGFGLSGQVKDVETKNLEKFATLEFQMGNLTNGMNTLLMEKNNEQIIQGVINRLWGGPTSRAC